jgi:hypothetical protein
VQVTLLLGPRELQQHHTTGHPRQLVTSSVACHQRQLLWGWWCLAGSCCLPHPVSISQMSSLNRGGTQLMVRTCWAARCSSLYSHSASTCSATQPHPTHTLSETPSADQHDCQKGTHCSRKWG